MAAHDLRSAGHPQNHLPGSERYSGLPGRSTGGGGRCSGRCRSGCGSWGWCRSVWDGAAGAVFPAFPPACPDCPSGSPTIRKPERAEQLQGIGIGGTFHQDDILRLQEDLGHQRNRLLRSGRDQDIFRAGLQALAGQDMGDALAQRAHIRCARHNPSLRSRPGA